jgi:hypothetical protein
MGRSCGQFRKPALPGRLPALDDGPFQGGPLHFIICNELRSRDLQFWKGRKLQVLFRVATLTEPRLIV